MNPETSSARRPQGGARPSLPDRVIGTVATLGNLLGALMVLFSVAAVGYSVAMRYLFNQPQVWTDELVGYLLVAIVMFGAADVLRRGEHIGVDLLTEHLGTRGRRIVEAGGLLAVMLVAGVLTVGGWEMVEFSAQMGLLSSGYLEMPMWIPQACVPLGAGLLGIAALQRLLALRRNRGES